MERDRHNKFIIKLYILTKISMTKILVDGFGSLRD